MNAEYTPTTEFMRSLYVDATEGHREDDPDDIERAAEFDRWLAGHDAEKDHRIGELLAVIEKAPHERECASRRPGDPLPESEEVVPGFCDCWKSTVDTSALAARDAEKWDEGFDAGERDAFDLEEHPDHECIANPYRALAEKGADR